MNDNLELKFLIGLLAVLAFLVISFSQSIYWGLITVIVVIIGTFRV